MPNSPIRSARLRSRSFPQRSRRSRPKRPHGTRCWPHTPPPPPPPPAHTHTHPPPPPARTHTRARAQPCLRGPGYLQTGYEWSDNSSSFFIKRVRLSLSGNIAPKLDYRVQIEFASPKIVDAYLCYRPFDELNLQLGEYKLPFSIENTEYVPLRYEL